MEVKYYLNKKTSSIKKEWPSIKKALLQNIKSNGWPRPPAFGRYKSFGHDELTAKHCYFRCPMPSDVDGIKIFDKDDQAAEHILMFCGLVIFIKHFDPINIRRP